MLQPNHGDSPQIAKYVQNLRRRTAKAIGEHTRVNKNISMYTHYNYKNTWVLIIHGMGGSAYKMSPYAKKFLDLGFNTITLNSKRSTFDLISNWETDITAALNLLKVKYNITPSVVYAQSLGAAATLSLAGLKKFSFKKIIVDSPFDDFVTTMMNMYPLLSHFVKPFISHLSFPDAIISKVRAINSPILYFSGTNDQATTPEQIKLLAENSKHATLVSIPNAGHCRAMYYSPKLYWNKIKEFLGDPRYL